TFCIGSLSIEDQLKCAGVTCPKQPILDCPKGSVLSKTYTPPAACCPSVPAFCTCNFRVCEERECSHGYQPVLVMEGKGIPGECCDEYECQREPTYETVSPITCPKLENCTLSEKDCPYGFMQDKNGCLLCKCLTNESCPDLDTYCSLQCPFGYETDDYGCPVCECTSQIPKCRPMSCSKTCPYGYVRNKHGCEMCRCVKCPPFTCDKECREGYQQNKKGCSICLCKDESGSGQQPDAVDLAVCKAPGGEFYVEGETWQLDECTYCTCRKGRVLCDTEVCPPVLCQTPVKSMDTCCNTCPDDHLKPLLPVNSSQPEYCISSEGEILLAGESWKANPCTSCTCSNGTIQCFSQSCPPAFCRVPVLRKGQCCPYCLDGTKVLPTLLSTLTPSVKTYPEDTEQWLSTTEVPHIISITEGKIQNEDYPSQTEVALIYQSAAWILAGILLTTVIFLIAALVINKKKWVQMPCYSAPKKTVILKKHVNKNSVVYMEPSKENAFRNVRNECRVNVPTEASSNQQ
ncbi:Cysteine-rich motor neuron 1 protein, partial [Acipenser ruthenus]